MCVACAVSALVVQSRGKALAASTTNQIPKIPPTTQKPTPSQNMNSETSPEFCKTLRAEVDEKKKRKSVGPSEVAGAPLPVALGSPIDTETQKNAGEDNLPH